MPPRTLAVCTGRRAALRRVHSTKPASSAPGTAVRRLVNAEKASIRLHRPSSAGSAPARDRPPGARGYCGGRPACGRLAPERQATG
jgi:hypothetical protein